MCGIFFVKETSDISYNNIYLEFEKSKNRGGIPPDDTKFYHIGEYYLGFHRLSINGLNSQEPSVWTLDRRGTVI